MRRAFLLAGVVLVLLGAVAILHQVSEACEDNELGAAYAGYPWCSDILDQMNWTFVGVMAAFAGVLVVALGGPLHWVLEREPRAVAQA